MLKHTHKSALQKLKASDLFDSICKSNHGKGTLFARLPNDLARHVFTVAKQAQLEDAYRVAVNNCMFCWANWLVTHRDLSRQGKEIDSWSAFTNNAFLFYELCITIKKYHKNSLKDICLPAHEKRNGIGLLQICIEFFVNAIRKFKGVYFRTITPEDILTGNGAKISSLLFDLFRALICFHADALSDSDLPGKLLRLPNQLEAPNAELSLSNFLRDPNSIAHFMLFRCMELSRKLHELKSNTKQNVTTRQQMRFLLRTIRTKGIELGSRRFSIPRIVSAKELVNEQVQDERLTVLLMIMLHYPYYLPEKSDDYLFTCRRGDSD